jgi:branched-chain amino acid aminotransferase
MVQIKPTMALDGVLLPKESVHLSVASSAVLYGLSIYSVVYGKKTDTGYLLFRLSDHLKRMQQSAAMLGFGSVNHLVDESAVLQTIKALNSINKPDNDQFFRITIHATDLVPGIRTSNLNYSISIFSYDAENILPQDGSRIKTSVWCRTADNAIPARAKVNGAYVNSALAKQDALDSGCDDCLFLNQNGYVSELSAANIFIIKNNTLITPDTSSDILEGITRRSILEIAKECDISVVERKVALTEIYTADEAFACGTSAFVSPITTLDSRIIGTGKIGPITEQLRSLLKMRQSDLAHFWTKEV